MLAFFKKQKSESTIGADFTGLGKLNFVPLKRDAILGNTAHSQKPVSIGNAEIFKDIRWTGLREVTRKSELCYFSTPHYESSLLF